LRLIPGEGHLAFFSSGEEEVFGFIRQSLGISPVKRETAFERE
jgi:hypothetical protein